MIINHGNRYCGNQVNTNIHRYYLMHPCLSIPELVDQLFSHFEPADAKTLAALARTCTMFHEPALDVLWRNQDTLMNLLRCMPPDLFVAEVSGDGSILQLQRPIVPTDWERPLFYAHRIKSFILDDPTQYFPHIFPAIASVIPTAGHIFPNLTSLDWSSHSEGFRNRAQFEQDFTHIRLFLTPKLTSFRCRLDELDCHFRLLFLLPRACPALAHFSTDHLWNDYATPEFHTRLALFVSQLANLESISILSPDMGSLEHLGRMATLKHLDLRKLPRQLLTYPTPEEPLFTGLRTITLTRVDFTLAAKLVSMCSTNEFTETHLHFNSYETLPKFQDVITSIAAWRRSHSSLRSLSIAKCTRDEISRTMPPLGSYQIDITTVQNLFCFPNLLHLHLTASLGFSLDDAAVDQLARSWPHLETLKLCSSRTYSRGVIPLTTLRSLCSLAQHCPHLFRVELAFDPSLIPTLPPTSAIPHRNLRFLHASHSPDPETGPVAKFLVALFPELEEIRGSTYTYQAWLKVETCFLKMKDASGREKRKRDRRGVGVRGSVSQTLPFLGALFSPSPAR
ncbi:hypothetical protein C8R43DRAFT_1127487 [Mycena crocata]|nr:hypothetical protein C8R43DRAFT_1127487 [Mycena crocata]